MRFGSFKSSWRHRTRFYQCICPSHKRCRLSLTDPRYPVRELPHVSLSIIADINHSNFKSSVDGHDRHKAYFNVATCVAVVRSQPFSLVSPTTIPEGPDLFSVVSTATLVGSFNPSPYRPIYLGVVQAVRPGS